jgi:HKD family nuclease
MLAFGPWTGPDHVLSDVWGLAAPQQLRVAAAFASEAGARTLRGLCPSRAFDAVAKRWLVGIENGLTQPEALAYLAELHDSEVRVPYGAKALESGGLRAPTFFHPKVYAYDSDGARAIVSASANLTEGGLIRNTEQFMAWSGDPSDAVAASFDSWWTETWAKSTVVTAEFIVAYEKIRPELQPVPKPPAAAPRAAPIYEAEPAPSDLKGAEWMWIEAIRNPEGGSRNQLELILTGYHFFYPDDDDPPRDTGRSLEFLDPAGNLFDNPDRIVHYNGPPFMPKGNAMWRVRLPTEHEGLSGYQDGGVAIRFTRTDAPDRYRIEFADLGGSEAAAWQAGSRKIATAPTKPPRNMGWA